MKYLVFLTAVLLSACSTIEQYYTGTSPETCYGLGNQQCVEQGYRDSMEMRPTTTVYELNRAQDKATTKASN